MVTKSETNHGMPLQSRFACNYNQVVTERPRMELTLSSTAVTFNTRLLHNDTDNTTSTKGKKKQEKHP